MAKSKSKPTLQQLTERSSPHDALAERALLGSLILDSTYCDSIEIAAEDFYSREHQLLYGHIAAIHEQGTRVDTRLLVDRLKKFGDYERIGGAPYLAEIAQASPIATNAQFYAGIVRGHSRQRRYFHASLEFAADALNARDTAELDAAVDRHEQLLGEIDDTNAITADALTASIRQTSLTIVERSRAERSTCGLLTGIPSLDAIIGGLGPKQVVTVAARPGCGKTSFGGHLALAAADQGAGILFISLEMSAEELHLRSLANRTQINHFRAQQGMLTCDEQERMLAAGIELDSLPIVIDDRSTQTLEQIRRRAQRLQRQGSLGVIVIDYLQLIEAADYRQPRAEQVARVSRGLKRLAKLLAVPIVALAQLNRSADNARPQLSHLRESGAIEQDSDVVVFLHSDDPKSKRLSIIVAKNRSGPVGDIEVNWDRATNTFREPRSAWEFPAA